MVDAEAINFSNIEAKLKYLSRHNNTRESIKNDNTLLPKNNGICFLYFFLLHLYTTFLFKINDKEMDEA